MSDYITDGVDMYEVIYERDDPNYGQAEPMRCSRCGKRFYR